MNDDRTMIAYSLENDKMNVIIYDLKNSLQGAITMTKSSSEINDFVFVPGSSNIAVVLNKIVTIRLFSISMS